MWNVLNWVIAFFALAIYFLWKIKKEQSSLDKESDSINGAILLWYRKNWTGFYLSILSVFLLMMSFINKETSIFIENFLGEKYSILPYFKILSLMIGLLNIIILEAFDKIGKSKLKKEEKKYK